MPTPVIIDTDIGGDIDDSWAVAMALRCPELDIRLVTTSTGDPTYRAAIAADLLVAAGRDDIPIGIGVGGTGHTAEPLAAVGSSVSLDNYRGGAVDGVAAIVATITATTEPVTIIALGPLSTVAAVLDARPDIVDNTRLVGMHGSYRRGYRGADGAAAEYNVAADVAAARRVFSTYWDQTLTPLDTCGSVLLRGDRYQTVKRATETGDDPLLAALFRQQRVWLDANRRPELLERRTTTLFDTVAVYLAYDESFVRMDDACLSIDDQGVFCGADDGPRIRLATEWTDQEAFLDHLTARLLGT